MSSLRTLLVASTAIASGLLVVACCCPSGDYETSSDNTDLGTTEPASGEGYVSIPYKDLGMVCATSASSSGLVAIPKNGTPDTGTYAETSKLVRDMIGDLGDNAGLRRKSIPPVFADPSVGGHVAVAATLLHPYAGYPKGQRLILYSPSHVNEHTKRSGTTGTIVFIFAHELGHHVNGHNVARPGASSHEKELEADYYAGFLMGLASERKSDTLAWIKSNVGPNDSASHPGRAKRLEAATEGWQKGCRRAGHCNE